MTGLLPEVVHDAIRDTSVYEASESYGLVALVLLVVLLVELEALRVTRRAHRHSMVLQALVVPLLVAVGLTIYLRVAGLLN